MLPMAFALVAAEKTAETSYAIYLYCAGSTLAGGAAVGGGIWLFSPKKTNPRSENDIAVDIELGLQQQQPLEFAADMLLNVDEQTQTALIQQVEHLEVLANGVHRLDEILVHAAHSTEQIVKCIQPLHETAIHGKETVQTMSIKLERAEEQLALVTRKLQNTQSALEEKELQLCDSMSRLTTSQDQLAVTSNATSRQLKHLSGQHQEALRLAHPNGDLNEQTHIEALKNTIEEQARLLLELSDENDALQERMNTPSIEKLSFSSSTQPSNGSAFTLFRSGR